MMNNDKTLEALQLRAHFVQWTLHQLDDIIKVSGL